MKKIELDGALIEKRYVQGDTLTFISKDFGVSRTRIGKILKDRGIQRVRGGTVPKSSYPEIKRLYCIDGKTQDEISAHLGINQKTVGDILRRLGIKIENRRELCKRLRDCKVDILKDYDNGVAIKDLSCKFGTCPSSMRKFLLDSGVALRPCFKGHKELGGKKWERIKRDAKKRGLVFDLDIKDTYDLFLSQKRKCALSGTPIYFSTIVKENTASLDRKNSLKGYVDGNVQWVHKDVNIMKRDLTDKRFVDVCKMVVKHMGSPTTPAKNGQGNTA